MNLEPALEADVRARKDAPERHGVAVRQMFDRIAPTYDLLNGVLSLGIDKGWRRRAARQFLDITDGPLLDLCAGTMDLTALLAEKYPERRLVAVDFSGAMLERGRTKAPKAEVCVADALHLPFEDGLFAGVICGFGMRNLSDTRGGICEIKRVLKAGGTFVTLEFFRPTRLAIRTFHSVFATLALPALGGLLSGNRGAYAYLSRSMKAFLTREEYESMLEESGFLALSSEDLTGGIASVVRAEVSS